MPVVLRQGWTRGWGTRDDSFFFKQFDRELDTWISASVEVFNGNLHNEVDYAMHFLDTMPKDKVCVWLSWQTHYWFYVGHICLEHGDHAWWRAPIDQARYSTFGCPEVLVGWEAIGF